MKIAAETSCYASTTPLSKWMLLVATEEMTRWKSIVLTSYISISRTLARYMCNVWVEEIEEKTIRVTAAKINCLRNFIKYFPKILRIISNSTHAPYLYTIHMYIQTHEKLTYVVGVCGELNT